MALEVCIRALHRYGRPAPADLWLWSICVVAQTLIAAIYLAIYLKFKHCASVVAFCLEVDAEGQSARISYTNGKCGCILLSHLLNRFIRPSLQKPNIYDSWSKGHTVCWNPVVVAALIMQIAKVVVLSQQQQKACFLFSWVHTTAVSLLHLPYHLYLLLCFFLQDAQHENNLSSAGPV